MKRIIALILVCLMILAASACGKTAEDDTSSSETETAAVQTQSVTHEDSAEFSDSSGRVVSKLLISIPYFDETAAPAGAKTVNAFFENYVNERAAQMQKDADNTSAYLEKYGIEGPRITEITYEVYYESDTLFSVILKTRTGVDIDGVQPTLRPLTFSLTEGGQMTVAGFALDDSVENVRDKMLEGIYKAADKTYSPNAVPISDEKKALINESFNETEFLVTDESYVFIFSFDYLSGGSRTGDYFCEVPMNYLGDYFIAPAEYGA